MRATRRRRTGRRPRPPRRPRARSSGGPGVAADGAKTSAKAMRTLWRSGSRGSSAPGHASPRSASRHASSGPGNIISPIARPTSAPARSTSGSTASKNRADPSPRHCRALLGLDAGPLEALVLVALAVEIAEGEEPAIAALGIGQYLPAIQVAIPEVEAVGAVLEDRLGDLRQPPFVLLLHGHAIALVDLLLGLDVETVVAEQAHRRLGLALDRGDGVVAAEPDHQRDRAGLDHVEAEEFLVKSTREIEVGRFQRAVRQEIKLQRRLRLFARFGGSWGGVFGHGSLRSMVVFPALRRCRVSSAQSRENQRPAQARRKNPDAENRPGRDSKQK